MSVCVNGKRLAKCPPAKTVADLLSKLKLSREESLVKVNGKLAAESSALKPSDRVEVIQVIFGG